MCGGGTQTSTQQVSIPPEVMARYNSVNARAEGVANQPFQQYGGEFVAPLNEVQQQGIQATGQASQSAQPYYQMGTGLTLAGTQAVGPLTSGQISTYMNPYIEGVVDPTLRALQQQQGQQLSQQQADAIKGGAFGGERSGIQRAMLQGQQNLATGQAIAPLYAQGYQQAVQTATGQQGVRAQDLARLAQAGQQIAGLGTGAQGAALQGAQAQIAAGTLGQQTAQAQKTAEYQQFLQERGYPYQQAQFLANIAMGTGALSGSTTTTESPAGFFSDRRLKENVKVVGETNDGQPIYRYNYKGEKKTQLGLIAQEVEKDHPEAVGESQGYKTVDYKKATDDSVRHHRAYGGGLDVNAFGGAVTEPGSYAGGGLVDSTDLSAILAQQKNFFGPYGKGLAGEGSIGGASGIPAASLAVPKLVTASSMPQQQRSGMSQAAETGKNISELAGMAKGAFGTAKEAYTTAKPYVTGGVDSEGTRVPSLEERAIAFGAPSQNMDMPRASGGVVPRGYAVGGEINPYALSADPMADVVQDGTQKAPELTKPGQAPGVKSPMSDVKDAVGLAGSVASAGTAISQFLPMLLAMSDERMKDNKEKIGKLFDGQPVYRYDFGDGNTQIGLMAQNVEKFHPEAVHETSSGIKMVNYDAATRDAANDRHGYSFGGMPRQGYADGSDVSITNPDEAAAAPHPADSIFEKRVIPRESGGKQFDKDGRPLTSPAGAIGIAQVMPGTAPEAAKMAGLVFDEDKYRNDPEYNKALGRAYFRAQYDRYNDPEMAMAAYNAGPGNVDKSIKSAQSTGGDWRSFLPNETKNYIGAPANLSMGKQAGSPAQPDKGSLSFSSFLPTQKDSSGKESTNWEKVLIPLLSGVGSALSSTRNTLGGALGEGLLGGISGYQNVSNMQADIPKKLADTALTQAEIPRTAMQTEGIKAGLYERRWVPNRGWLILDKPNNKFFFATDTNLNPVNGTGFEKTWKAVPVAAGADQPKPDEASTAGKEEPKTGASAKTGEPKVQTGPETDISKLIPPPKSVVDWTPVTKIPVGYEPEGHMNINLNPENAKKYGEEGIKMLDAQNQKAEAAGKQRIELEGMSANLDRLPQNSFEGTTGPGADMRLKFANSLNTAASIIGTKPLFDPNQIAAQEQIKKGTFRFGAALANSIGTREPGFIVAQSVAASPSIENSEKGFRLLVAGLRESAKYDEDKAKFYDAHQKQFGHLSGAKEAFEKVNKPELYAQRAVVSAVDPVVLEDLKKYGPAQMRPIIDKVYGSGITNILIGGR